MFYLGNDLSDKSTFIGLLDSIPGKKIKIKLLNGVYRNSIVSVSKNKLWEVITRSMFTQQMSTIVGHLASEKSSSFEYRITLLSKIEELQTKLLNKLSTIPYHYGSVKYQSIQDEWLSTYIEEHSSLEEIQYLLKYYTISRTDHSGKNYLSNLLGYVRQGVTLTITNALIRLKNESIYPVGKRRDILNVSFKIGNKKRTISLRNGEFIILTDQSLSENVVVNSRTTELNDLMGEPLTEGDFIVHSLDGRASILRIDAILFDTVEVTDTKDKKKRVLSVTDINSVKIDQDIMDRILIKMLSV